MSYKINESDVKNRKPRPWPPDGSEPKSKFNREKLLSFAGIWSDVDIGRFIEDLYRARHEAPIHDPPKG